LIVDIDHIGERSMTRPATHTFAAVLATVMMVSLWLPTLAPQSNTALPVAAALA
jgi:hypothetical protein